MRALFQKFAVATARVGTAAVARSASTRIASRRAGAVAILAVVSTLLLAASPAFAQQAGLQVAQGPYYVGVPIDLQLVLEGFLEEPSPEVTATPPPGTTLTFVQARPQVSSMMSIVNGKVTQSKEVRFGFVYQLTPSSPGRITLGPFTATQGPHSVQSRTITLNVTEIPVATGQKLRVALPPAGIFIGQRVPVTVEWWTEAGLADRLYNQRMNLPLFLDTTNFQFLDEKKPDSRIAISVDTPTGATDFAADVKQVMENGKQWVVRSFTRTLVPVGSGRFDLGRASLYCDEAVAWRRDFFGTRVPSQVRKLRVASDPLVLDVKAVPAVGRPASFAGAIGQGFTLDVAADRTVVQTGDPVRLTFTLHGDGSFDSASLPPLGEAGLSPKQFRLPDGEVAGIVEHGAKKFEVTVRVLDPGVREIPPVEYSWFDPSTGGFDSTRSEPIALSVKAATVVGAGDVVSASPAEVPEEEEPGGANGKDSPAAKPGSRADGPARAPAFTLTGADLSIETDLSRLRASSSSLLGSPSLAWGAYVVGIMLLVAGVVLRRRRDTDPAVARLAADRKALRGRVASDRSAREVAEALRKLIALHDGTRSSDADDVLARLDEAVYAPGGASAAVAEDLRRRALAAADALLAEDGR